MSMTQHRLALMAVAVAFLAPSSRPVSASPAAGDTYYPLAKGSKWVYSTDYADDTELVHEITGVEKIGDVECFIVEHKTVGSTLGTRLMRKEWLAADADGILIHKVSRGKSELDVQKPFFKIKHILRKDDEWKGQAKAEENPPVYEYRVEGEEDIEVPAGKYRAVKVHLKIESGTRHSAEGSEWYAKNVGVVKSEITIRAGGEDFTMVSELKKYEAGK
ncbi:MAG TPA: hypothetical protein VKW04_14075 [Planctomycetota bacterium]|nr:hypothetical protein [Planctomycetota bacterium]